MKVAQAIVKRGRPRVYFKKKSYNHWCVGVGKGYPPIQQFYTWRCIMQLQTTSSLQTTTPRLTWIRLCFKCRQIMEKQHLRSPKQCSCGWWWL